MSSALAVARAVTVAIAVALALAAVAANASVNVVDGNTNGFDGAPCTAEAAAVTAPSKPKKNLRSRRRRSLSVRRAI